MESVAAFFRRAKSHPMFIGAQRWLFLLTASSNIMSMGWLLDVLRYDLDGREKGVSGIPIIRDRYIVLIFVITYICESNFLPNRHGVQFPRMLKCGTPSKSRPDIQVGH